MKLFDAFDLAGLELRNRVVMAPMTRSRAAPGGCPGPLQAEYYGQRAGAGLIVTEGTSPSPNGLGYPRIPGLFSVEQIEGWKPSTRAVHEKGGRIFAQLMHVGRVAHQDNLPAGAEVIAPSAVELPGEMYTDNAGPQPHTPAREMQPADIAGTVVEFAEAGSNAVTAGFDGVEVHAANGYLVEQFLHPHTNRRRDNFGGSIENRARFALQVVDALVEAIGANRVGIRLSPYGVFNDMPHYPQIDATYAYLAGELSRRGIAYVHLVDHSAMGAPPVPDAIKREIRGQFTGALILSGGYDAPRAEADLQAGHCDLVAFGRPFIANPDLVAFGRPFIANPDLVDRLRDGSVLAEPDPDTFYTPGAEGYTDYPTAG